VGPRRRLAGPHRLVDLDGDGADEILVEASIAHGGTEYAGLRVLRLAGATLTGLLDLQTGFSDAAAGEDELAVTACDAEVEVTDPDAAGARRLVITATVCQMGGGRVQWTADGDAVYAQPLPPRGRGRQRVMTSRPASLTPDGWMADADRLVVSWDRDYVVLDRDLRPTTRRVVVADAPAGR
jgi:hypothetical protein